VIAVSAAGAGVGVAWVQGTASNVDHVFMNRFGTTTWTGAAQVDGTAAGNVGELGLSMTSPEAGVAAWTARENPGSGRIRVFGAALTGGVWSAANVLDPVSDPGGLVVPTGDAQGIAVAAVAGTAFVTWAQSASGTNRIFAARLDAGSGS
jgi:hypothetical protein